jgi:RES domain-containing protein
MSRSLAEKIRNALEWAAPFSGVCFRNVSQEFANVQDILSAQGSLHAGGRFNFMNVFAVLYLSCDLHTCVEETTKSARLPEMEVANVLPRTLIGIEVMLSRVLNLTDATIRRRLRITKKSLIADDWEKLQNVDKQEAFTQQIGRLAREIGFEAILVPLAVTRGKNLDVFPDRLLPSSSLKIINRHLLPLPKH